MNQEAELYGIVPAVDSYAPSARTNGRIRTARNVADMGGGVGGREAYESGAGVMAQLPSPASSVADSGHLASLRERLGKVPPSGQATPFYREPPDNKEAYEGGAGVTGWLPSPASSIASDTSRGALASLRERLSKTQLDSTPRPGEGRRGGGERGERSGRERSGGKEESVGGQREDASAERPAPRRKKKIIAIQVLEDPTGGKTAAQLVREMLRQANDPMSEMRNTMGLENLTGSQFYLIYCPKVQTI